MKPQAVRDYLRDTPTGERVAMTVRWPVHLDMGALMSVTDVRERVTKLRRLYNAAKEPLLGKFEQVPGMMVANAMEGTDMAVVAAPAGVWSLVLGVEGAVTSPRFEPAADLSQALTAEGVELVPPTVFYVHR